MLPGDEARIKEQIEAAEKTIEQDTAEFNNLQTADSEEPSEGNGHQQPANGIVDTRSDLVTVGQTTTNTSEPTESLLIDDANPDPVTHNRSDAAAVPESDVEASKNTADESSEVVLEAEEDTVIY